MSVCEWVGLVVLVAVVILALFCARWAEEDRTANWMLAGLLARKED